MADEFNPEEFNKFKSKAKLDDSTGFDPKEFEGFKGSQGPTVLGEILNTVGGALKAQVPQAIEAATLGTNAAPQMAERVTNYMQKRPNTPGHTLMQMAANRPDVTAQLGVSYLPGAGLAPAALRTVGSMAAGALSQDDKVGNALFSGGVNAAFEALPYGLGKLASLFNRGKGVIGAGREAGVTAAKELGVPLTRAEQTGNMFDTAVESTLGKSLTGGEIIQAAKAEADTVFTAVKSQLKQQFGTTLQPSAIGSGVKEGIESNIQGLKSKAQEIYQNLPNPRARPEQLRAASENLIREQLQLPRVDRDKALIRRLMEYRNLGLKVEKKVQQITDSFGFTQQITKLQKVEHPASYPTLTALKRMSSNLGDAWRKSMKAGETMGTVGGRDATVLSSAIQQDIRQVGELRQSLSEADKLYRQAKVLDKNQLIKRLRTAGPEEATQIIFNGKKRSNILLAKKVLGPKFDGVKASYFNQLIDDPQLGKKLADMSEEYKVAVFSGEELQKLNQIAEIQKVRGAADKLQGTSGSARTNAILRQLADVKNGLYVAAGGALSLNPMVAGAGLLAAAGSYYGPRMAANAYLKQGMNPTNFAAMVPKAFPKARTGLQTIRQYLLGQTSQPGSR